MPISIEVSKGLLTAQGEREVFPHVAAALLEAHGLTGNPFMTANVIGHMNVKPELECFVGGKPQSLAVIEVTVPAVTFPNAEVAQAFVGKVTEIIDRYKAGAHPRERTYVVVKHAVDGPWGIAGKAYSNAELSAAIRQSATA